MRKMKDSDVEWIGCIPDNWKREKLIRIFSTIGSGTTPKSSNEDFYDGDIHWIQSGDINGSFLDKSKAFVTEGAIQSFSALKIYKAPFVIMAMYGASIGNLSMSKIDGCVNQACCVMRDGVQDIKFAFYALKSAKEYLIWKAVGGGQPNISQDTIKQLWLPMPPLDEQRRIADFLDRRCAEIDRVIDATQQTIAEYKALKQSIITEAVTKGVRGPRPMKDSGVEWIGEIPEEWECCKLKHIISTLNSGASITATELTDGGYPVYGGGQQIGSFTEFNVEDSLIIGRVGARCGCITRINGKAWATDNALIIQTDFPIDYLYYILVSAELNRLNSSNAQPLITSSKVLNLKAPICFNQSEQSEIVLYLKKRCSKVDGLIEAKQQLLTELENYKKSVIYEYVTGKKEAPAC